jgi:hypothetical protein
MDPLARYVPALLFTAEAPGKMYVVALPDDLFTNLRFTLDDPVICTEADVKGTVRPLREFVNA